MRKDINKIVGIVDNEVYILKYVFEDVNGFKGAVGYSMIPLTEAQVVDYRSDPEYLRDLWELAESELKLEDFAERSHEEAEYNGCLYCGDDNSFREEFEDLIEQLPEDRKKLIKEMTDLTWTCCGCGRHFEKDMKFDIVFEPEVVKLINQYEEK